MSDGSVACCAAPGRRLAAFSSVGVEHRYASLLGLAMHPAGHLLATAEIHQTRPNPMTAAAKIVSITRFELTRLFRERSNLFFVLIFPVLIIAVLGTQFGDNTPEVGVAGSGDLVDRAVERLESTGAADVRRVDTAGELEDLVAEETLPVGMVVPDGAVETLRAGDELTLTVLLGSGDDAAQLQGVVGRAFEAEAVVPGVTGQLLASADAPADEVSGVVSQTAAEMPAVEIDRVAAGGGDTGGEYGIDQIAVGMLLLMTFLNTFVGAAALIQSRKYGISRRMVATPTSVRTIVIGAGAGRWSVGLFQAVYIMLATTLLFDVSWGYLPGAIVVIVLFAAVAAGAAMLVGAVLKNDEQAAGITVMVGLGLGALGGSMLPLDLFGSTMRTVAHVTPHAWASDAFAEMTRHGGTLADILPQLGVLAAFAVVLMGLAAWRLRVTLTRL